MSENAIKFWDTRFDRSEIRSELTAGLPNYLNKGLAFLGPVEGKKVLDIGCGLGENSIALARLGANVTAIDTSSIAISKINAFAENEGLPITGIVHDAMQIATLGTFDIVVGAMVLHHLEPFGDFCDSLAAVLKPGGKAFFYENNAASRLLVWCRKNLAGRFGIPKYGDNDEFPLTPQEVDRLRHRFKVTQEFPEMVFFTMASVYLFRKKFDEPCKRVDSFLYNNNILRSYSYRQILMLEQAA